MNQMNADDLVYRWRTQLAGDQTDFGFEFRN